MEIASPGLQVDRLNLFLIKPSKYDDEGYVIRHWKGVLSSNTLACLCGLTEDVRERKVLGERLKWHIQAIDETVERVDTGKIIRKSRQKGSRTLVCLVGVQSNQFPRASDLALEFRKAGIPVIIGGFHVSGVLSTLKSMTPELSLLSEAGVSLVAGEAEYKWESILRDALHDELKPVYNFLHELPDLSGAPMPLVPKSASNRYAVKHFATLDCGRGCPFGCSFCTVINVQGRRMRFRSVECIMKLLRTNYEKHNLNYYFFTDDNFCRNKNWEEILDGMIRFREEEKIPFTFMMQVDTRAYLIPNFIEKARRAGCTQVFIGMESINPDNLKAASKNQNKIQDFKTMIDCYHKADIATHLAYIIGFPFDTAESLRSDMKNLMDLGAKQTSFFILTPIPGSEDYVRFLQDRRIVDADLNNFDSFHTTFKHGRMSASEWQGAYDEAWKLFYSTENMKRILRDTNPEKFWDVFMNFVWYKNAIQVEGGHPMISGFVRLKKRRDRRPGYPLESRWVYFKRRVKENTRMVINMLKLAWELEEAWLATHHRTPLENKVIAELAAVQKNVQNWRSMGLKELQNLYKKAAEALRPLHGHKPSLIKIPSRFKLWLRKWDAISDSLTHSRFPMAEYWRETKRRLKQGRLDKIRPDKLLFTIWLEIVLFTRFVISLLRKAGNN